MHVSDDYPVRALSCLLASHCLCVMFASEREREREKERERERVRERERQPVEIQMKLNGIFFATIPGITTTRISF